MIDLVWTTAALLVLVLGGFWIGYRCGVLAERHRLTDREDVAP
jgi:hypothetical protein